jgi:hypothetical protein
MKNDSFCKPAALVLVSSAILAFSACNGGGSAATTASTGASSADSSDTPTPTSFVNTNGAFVDSLGGSEFLDTSNGDLLENIGGNEFLNQTTGGVQFENSTSTGSSKDTDLQKADVQKMNVTARAEGIANRFQMSLQASVQLVQLSDRVKLMGAQGAMSASDRAAVTNAGLAIAGVTPAQVNQAIQKGLNGDDSAAEAVLSKAAQNLGMPSAANLRDQLLPALGVQIQ